MGISRTLLLSTAALLAASCALQAESGNWGGQIGGAQPSGDAKAWVGQTSGFSVDILDTYPLGNQDAVRMRFGFTTFKATSANPETLVLSSTAAASYPANTVNELFTFTYGGEYVYTLPARLYVLGGLGVAYVTATRKGTFDLTSAGNGQVATNYSANNFVPYFCAGAGWQITPTLALEARWQTTSLKAQVRPIDLSAGGFTAPGQVQFDKLSVSSLSLGLSLTF